MLDHLPKTFSDPSIARADTEFVPSAIFVAIVPLKAEEIKAANYYLIIKDENLRMTRPLAYTEPS